MDLNSGDSLSCSCSNEEEEEEEEEGRELRKVTDGREVGCEEPFSGRSSVCHWLPREQRVGVGRMCKGLIDQGRLEWLRRRVEGGGGKGQGGGGGKEGERGSEGHGTAELVEYCQPEVSGECRLFLAVLG